MSNRKSARPSLKRRKSSSNSKLDDLEELETPDKGAAPVIQILGDIFTDILAVVPPPGFKVGGDTLSKINVLAGGSGLNVSVHLAAYLRRNKVKLADSDSSSPTVAMFSCVGDDLHGQLCTEHLRSSGVDTAGVHISKRGFKTGSCIVLSASSERSFVTDAACISEELALPLFLHTGSALFQPPACHFHISGYFNLNQLRADGELRRALAQAKAEGLPTSLNPQYDSLGLWDGIHSVAPVLDILVANEEEIMQIANSHEKSLEKQQPQTLSLSRAVARVLSWGCGCVVATLGARGATAFFRTNEPLPSSSQCSSPGGGGYRRRGQEHRSTRTVTQQGGLVMVELEVVGRRLDRAIVDTTGAGDAFTGAFIGALHVHAPSGNTNTDSTTDAANKDKDLIPQLPFSETQITVALQAGCEAGAFACTCLGGSTVPDLSAHTE